MRKRFLNKLNTNVNIFLRDFVDDVRLPADWSILNELFSLAPPIFFQKR